MPQVNLSARQPPGTNAGYPFTYYNSCLAADYAAAITDGNAAVYPTYTAIDGRHTSTQCLDDALDRVTVEAEVAARPTIGDLDVQRWRTV
jgi:hypothetical protein